MRRRRQEVSLTARGALPKLSRISFFHWQGPRKYLVSTKENCHFYYLSAGRLTVEVEGLVRTAETGDFLNIFPGTRYALRCAEGETATWYHGHFCLSGLADRAGSARVRHRGAFQPSPDWANTLIVAESFRVDDPPAVEEEFTRILREQRGEAPGFALATAARFLLLLLRLARERHDRAKAGAGSAGKGAGALRVARALDFIEKHLEESIGLFEVAQSLRLNPQYLARLFHQRMGRSVGKYIAQRKMDLARERLCTTNLSLKEIALSLGFRDPLYFSRVFRRVMGCSPREYALRQGLQSIERGTSLPYSPLRAHREHRERYEPG